MIVAWVCPISGESRDEHAVRIVAAFVVTAAIVAVVVRGTFAGVLLLALAGDFAVRAFSEPRFSALARAAVMIVRKLQLTPKPTNAAPKRFAAKIGIAFSITAGVLFLAGFPVAATAVTLVLGFCAFLESAFAICIGCKVHALLPRRH